MLKQNPFIISKDVPEAFFCDRNEETQQLIKQISNGRNVALISPRRLGKTGLIFHTFRQEEIEKDYNLFFVDLYSTTSLAELVLNFGKEVLRQLRSRGESVRERFFSIIKSLRMGISLDSVTGDPSLEIGLGNIESPQTTLDEIFEYLESADRPCLVAIDEFQRIADYPEKNVEALLRTKIQRCHNTSFIYSGSKRHTMSMMFNSPSRPFYNSSINMGLGAIPCDVYADFACRLFAQNNKTLTADVVEDVYSQYEGYTWFLQMMMNELYAITPEGGNCTKESIPIALHNLLSIQEMSFEEMLSLVPQKQKALLLAIARERKANNITSARFIKCYGISTPSSVQSALKLLMEKDLVIKCSDGSYRIENFFFAEWLRRK